MIKELKMADGRTLINVPADPQTLRELGVPQDQADTLVQAAWEEEAQLEAKRRLRLKIHEEAGDALSLIGTHGDMMAVLLRELSQFFNGVSQATTIAAIKTAAQPLAALTADLVTGTAEGDAMTFPYEKKGEASDALLEFKDRAQTISDLLA